MKLIRIPEAASILDISTHFARKLIREGYIKPVRIGRAVRIRLGDVERIIAEGRLIGLELKK